MATDFNSHVLGVGPNGELPPHVFGQLDLPDKAARDDMRAIQTQFAATLDATDPTVANRITTEGTQTRAALTTEFATNAAALAPAIKPRARRVKKWVTTFSAGHGWSAAEGATDLTTVAGTTPLGSTAAKFTVPTAVTNGSVEAHQQAPYDATGQHLVVWVKMSAADLANLGSIEAWVGSGTGATWTAYHRLIGWSINAAPKPTTGDRWTLLRFVRGADSTITAGTPNLKAVTQYRIRLVTHTGGGATLTVGGVGWVDKGDIFPTGAFVFTFDDGYTSVYDTARPMLDRHGFPATWYIIQEWVGKPNLIDLPRLEDLRDKHGWEIGGHAYSQAVHDGRINQLPLDVVDTDMRRLKAWLTEHGFNSDSYCYPGGEFNDASVEIVSRYFNSARTISTRPFYNSPNALDPLLLTTPYTMSGAVAESHVAPTVEHGLLTIFVDHDVTPAKAAGVKALIDLVAASGGEVLTMREAMNRIATHQPALSTRQADARYAPLAGGGGSVGSVLTAFKPADTVRNNTATATVDPDLVVTLAPNSTYIIEAFLPYNVTATADLKVDWIWPNGRTGVWMTGGPLATSTSVDASENKTRFFIGQSAVLGGAGNVVAQPTGQITTASSGGAFGLSWSQNVAEASDATVQAGAWLKLTKVA